MKIIDLTHVMTHQMAVFPADPAVGILRHHNYQNGYLVHQLIFGTHTGTHIDVPIHKIKGGKSTDQVPIDRFIGRTYVLDIKGLAPLDEITVRHLSPFEDKVKDVSSIIIRTGWGSHFGKDDFFTSFPGLSEESVDWLVLNNISLVGLETPSVNAVKHAEIHTLLLQKDIYVVEALACVEEISQEYVDFFAVPLSLKDMDGSPVRAFVIEE